MTRLIGAAIGVALAAAAVSAPGVAEAKTHRGYRSHHHHRVHHHRGAHRQRGARVGGTLVTVQSAAGPITVSSRIANAMTGFISDVVARGFRGPVHCFSATGHVPRSNHHWGGACDFAQHGWGLTVSVMHGVSDLAAKWGLRDGCSFRRPDCGHIDAGEHRVAHRSRRVRTARL